MKHALGGILLCFAFVTGCADEPRSRELPQRRPSPQPETPDHRILRGAIRYGNGVYSGSGVLVFDETHSSPGHARVLELELEPGGWVQFYSHGRADLSRAVAVGFRRQPRTDLLEVLVGSDGNLRNASMDFEGARAEGTSRVELRFEPDGIEVRWRETRSRRFEVDPVSDGNRWGMAMDGAVVRIGVSDLPPAR